MSKSFKEFVKRVWPLNKVFSSAALPPTVASLCEEPARLPAEPILYEKAGWGLYTPQDFVHSLEGSALKHVGCDCVYPNWSFAHLVWQGELKGQQFTCTECKDVLPEEVFREFVQVYRFINNL